MSAPPAKMPRQIPFIIGNEGCERFSFYGMRNILPQFLVTSLFLFMDTEGARKAHATEVFHIFVMGVYFFPLLGGWIADRFFGKYRTILWFSLIYCAGHACLALFDDSVNGFYAGLVLIALGAGGIKPLVASFMGDQFDDSNKHLAKIVFDAFYWIINFGSFFASLLMPILLAAFGPQVAFGIPGILMFVATVVFWIGRKRYVMTPVSVDDPNSFMRVVRTSLFSSAPGRANVGLYVTSVGFVLALGLFGLWHFFGVLDIVQVICLALVIIVACVGIGASLQLDRAIAKHGETAVEGVRAVFRILIVFALVTPFHSLFDQKATTWVFQGGEMNIPTLTFGQWEIVLQPGQMQAVNPALVMLLIPFNNLVLYPWLRRRGWEPTALRRMTCGIVFAAVAWIAAGILQLAIDGAPHKSITILWQMLPYLFLTFGEVLVSATGLEFAYSQASLAMKGVIMSFWNLTTTIGSLWVILVNRGVRNESVLRSIESTGISQTAFLMFFFAAFAGVAAFVFWLYAKRYRVTDNYRPGTTRSASLPTATAIDK